jgi:hypothetical protein
MITKPPVWGGKGPYKDCRATDDDDLLKYEAKVNYSVTADCPLSSRIRESQVQISTLGKNNMTEVLSGFSSVTQEIS